MTNATPRCRAVALTCIDFRFVEALHELLRARELTGTTDLVAWPGGALGIVLDDARPLLDVLALARDLHGVEEAVLIAHEGCGWLAARRTFADAAEEARFEDQALRDAAAAVAAALPAVRVSCVRLEASGAAIDVPVARER